ncbi:MAG: helix-turn-helix transcriptional regulator [Candidatus Limiplasma sp.]|nr:helix-turn-helix domain-containing protein [Clostridiales bacterium]MDY4061571.1 helix-turn-helix transcriptional regulator [Candidatus Limiplasma sp.]
MDDLKYTTASNIINLRQKAGMTQSELAGLINYSDKSVSKWERAEAVPDAYVLKKMSEIFGVTVDYLLNPHDGWDQDPRKKKPAYSNQIIMLLSVTGVWMLALILFISLWMLGNLVWIIFIYAILFSMLVLLVLNSVLEQGRHNYLIIGALILSIVASLYFSFLYFGKQNYWQLYLLLAPAWLVVFLTSRLRKRPEKEQKS